MESWAVLACYVVALTLLLPYISSLYFIGVVIVVALLSTTISKRCGGKYFRYFNLLQRIGKVTNYTTHNRHTCLNCGNTFVGNFCPYCGQSGDTQLTIHLGGLFKHIISLLMKFGNGMGRTLIDLLWRPGFLIRDYLQGRRMSYAPPFLTLLFMLILSAFIRTNFPIEQNPLEFQSETAEESKPLFSTDNPSIREMQSEIKNVSQRYVVVDTVGGAVKKLVVSNKRLLKITCVNFPILIVIFSLLFRNQTVGGRRLNVAEYFVVMCYVMALVHIAYSLLYLSGNKYSVLSAAILMLIVIIKQLFDGFSWRKAALYALLVSAIFLAIFFTILMIVLDY